MPKVAMIAILMTMMVFTTGCKETKEAQDTLKEGGKTIVSQPDRARALSDITALRSAVQSYQAQHGEFPKTLEELNVSLNFPNTYTYDAATGQVKSQNFPNL